MKLRIGKYSFLVIFAGIIFQACNNESSRKERFELFFERAFDVKLQNGVYYIVDLNLNCECAEDHLRLLASNPCDENNLNVILSGRNRKISYYPMIAIIESNYRVFIDSSNLSYDYGFATLYPEIVQFSAGEFSSVQIKDNDMDLIEKFLPSCKTE